MTECPHCHAPLPQPPERFCPSCGTDLAAAGGFEPPPPGYPPSGGYPPPGGYAPPGGGYPPPPGSPPPPRGQTPWERRQEIGLLNALVETTKLVLSRPTEFFRAMPITGGVGEPLLYAVIVGYVGLFASTVYNIVFRSVLGASLSQIGMAPDMERALAPLLRGGMVGVIVNLVFGPVFIAIGLFIGAGILHLILLVLASGGRGFEATFRVAAYTEAAALFNVVPLCGGLIGAVFAIVLLVIGLSEAHGITRGKAAAVVVAPLVLVCCCCLGVAFLIGMMGGLAGLGHMNR